MRKTGLTTYFIGDSITFGYTLADKTTRFADTVNANISNIRKTFYVNNGYTGYTSGQVLPIARTMPKLIDPDIIVIMIGTNDTSGSVAQATINANITAMITAFKNNKINGLCDIYLCTPTPRFDAVDLTATWATVRQVATSTGVTLIELSTILPDATYTADNLHPTTAGHQLISTAIWNVINGRQSVWKS